MSFDMTDGPPSFDWHKLALLVRQRFSVKLSRNVWEMEIFSLQYNRQKIYKNSGLKSEKRKNAN